MAFQPPLNLLQSMQNNALIKFSGADDCCKSGVTYAIFRRFDRKVAEKLKFDDISLLFTPHSAETNVCSGGYISIYQHGLKWFSLTVHF